MPKQEGIIFRMIIETKLNVFLISRDKKTSQLGKETFQCRTLVSRSTTMHVIYLKTQWCMKIFSIFDRIRLSIYPPLCFKERKPWLNPPMLKIISACDCIVIPLLLFPLSEIVIPGIILLIKSSHKSEVDSQEKILKIICSPVRHLLESVWFSPVRRLRIVWMWTENRMYRESRYILSQRVNYFAGWASSMGMSTFSQRLFLDYCMFLETKLLDNIFPPLSMVCKIEGWKLYVCIK